MLLEDFKPVKYLVWELIMDFKKFLVKTRKALII